MIGSSVSIGLSASQSGTFIRGFVSRLISAEKTGKKLFDGLNLQFEGTTLTFRKFSEIASQDVFKALDILGENFDKLSENKDVLKAMFTQRQFVRVIPILKGIAEQTGEADSATRSWMEAYTQGRSVAEDFTTQMESMGNQVDRFKNNIMASKKAMLEMIKDMGSGVLPVANDFLEWASNADSVVAKTGVQVMGLVSAFTALSMAVSAFKALGGMNVLLGAVSGGALPIMAITAVLGGTLLAVQNIKKERERELEVIKKQKDKLKEMKKINQEMNDSLIEDYSELKKGTYIIRDNWNTTVNLMQKAVNSSKELQGLFTSMGDLSKIKLPSLEGFKESLTGDFSELRGMFSVRDRYTDQLNAMEKVKKKQKEIDDMGRFKSKEEKEKAGQLNKEIRDIERRYKFVLSEKDLKDKILVTETHIEAKRGDISKTLKEASDNAKEYGANIDLARSKLESSHKTIKEFILSQKSLSDFKTFEEYKTFLDKYSPETLSVFKKLGIESDKLAVIQSKVFRNLAPIISGAKEHIKTTKDQVTLDKESLKTAELELKKVKDNIKDKIIGKDISVQEYKILKEKEGILISNTGNLKKDIETKEKSIESSKKEIKMAEEFIKNAEEVNKQYSETSEIYLPKTLEELNKIYEIDKLIGKSGLDRIQTEKTLLELKKTELETKMSGYDKEVAKLEEMKSKGVVDKKTGVVTFKGSDEPGVKKQNAEYEKQVKIVEGMVKTREQIKEIEEALIENGIELTEYKERGRELDFESSVYGKTKLVTLNKELYVLGEKLEKETDVNKKKELELEVKDKIVEISDEQNRLEKEKLDYQKEINKENKEELETKRKIAFEQKQQALSQVGSIGGQLGIEGAGGITSGIGALMGTAETGSLFAQMAGATTALGAVVPMLGAVSAGISIFKGVASIFGDSAETQMNASLSFEESVKLFRAPEGSGTDVLNQTVQDNIKRLDEMIKATPSIQKDFDLYDSFIAKGVDPNEPAMKMIVSGPFVGQAFQIRTAIERDWDEILEVTKTSASEIGGIFKTALDSDDFYLDLENGIQEAMVNGMENAFLGQTEQQNLFKNLEKAMTNAVLDGTVTGLEMANIRSLTLEAENQMAHFKNLRDALSFDSEVEYKTQQNKIEYSTGSTQNVVNNYYQTVAVDVGNFIGLDDNGAYQLADILVEPLEEIAGKR